MNSAPSSPSRKPAMASNKVKYITKQNNVREVDIVDTDTGQTIYTFYFEPHLANAVCILLNEAYNEGVNDGSKR